MHARTQTAIQLQIWNIKKLQLTINLALSKEH